MIAISGTGDHNNVGNYPAKNIYVYVFISSYRVILAQVTRIYVSIEAATVQYTPNSWNMGLGRFMLAFLLPQALGLRTVIFQLSGFYSTCWCIYIYIYI